MDSWSFTGVENGGKKAKIVPKFLKSNLYLHRQENGNNSKNTWKSLSKATRPFGKAESNASSPPHSIFLSTVNPDNCLQNSSLLSWSFSYSKDRFLSGWMRGCTVNIWRLTNGQNLASTSLVGKLSEFLLCTLSDVCERIYNISTCVCDFYIPVHKIKCQTLKWNFTVKSLAEWGWVLSSGVLSWVRGIWSHCVDPCLCLHNLSLPNRLCQLLSVFSTSSTILHLFSSSTLYFSRNLIELF